MSGHVARWVRVKLREAGASGAVAEDLARLRDRPRTAVLSRVGRALVGAVGEGRAVVVNGRYYDAQHDPLRLAAARKEYARRTLANLARTAPSRPKVRR